MFCITFEGYFSVITCLIVYLLLILASSVVETVPMLSGIFLPWKKPCRCCREYFFRRRSSANKESESDTGVENSADVVGNISTVATSLLYDACRRVTIQFFCPYKTCYRHLWQRRYPYIRRYFHDNRVSCDPKSKH